MSHQAEALLARMRAGAMQHGTGWLAQQVRTALPHLPPVSDVPGPRRASRRSRPPERLSPDNTPRARRRIRSPSQDPGRCVVGSQVQGWFSYSLRFFGSGVGLSEFAFGAFAAGGGFG